MLSEQAEARIIVQILEWADPHLENKNKNLIS